MSLTNDDLQAQSESTEMYLITVYRLTRKAPAAVTKDIADMLKVSPPSVSERIKRLAQQGYVNHAWREGTTLTKTGERIAVNVLRKHRLVETFLVEMAGYTLDEIHDEACQIEHAISDRLADRLEVMLAHPNVDPHGHPIPTKDGEVTALHYRPLAEITPGEPVVIRQVSDWERAQLSYLQTLGMVPGAEIEILDRAPFDGPLTIKLGDKVFALAQEIAQTIGVQ